MDLMKHQVKTSRSHEPSRKLIDLMNHPVKLIDHMNHQVQINRSHEPSSEN